MRCGAAGVWVGKQLLKATDTHDVDETKQKNEKNHLMTSPAEMGWIYVAIILVHALHSDKHEIFHSYFLERREVPQICATNEQLLSFYFRQFIQLKAFCVLMFLQENARNK